MSYKSLPDLPPKQLLLVNRVLIFLDPILGTNSQDRQQHFDRLFTDLSTIDQRFVVGWARLASFPDLLKGDALRTLAVFDTLSPLGKLCVLAYILRALHSGIPSLFPLPKTLKDGLRETFIDPRLPSPSRS